MHKYKPFPTNQTKLKSDKNWRGEAFVTNCGYSALIGLNGS